MIKQTGEWTKMRAAMRRIDAKSLRLAEGAAVYQEAHLFRKKIIECFNSSGRSNGIQWEPNKPSVLANKRSSKPLIDTADLKNSVQVVGRNQYSAEVGIPNKARNRDGVRMTRIAEVHEFGKVIVMEVTLPMFRYVMAMMSELGGPAGAGTGQFRPGAVIVINIPARSFIQSTVDAHFDPLIVRARFIRRVGLMLGGTWAALAAGGGASLSDV